MFCFQCEQTSKGTGCTEFATCGKDENSAILQDLLIHATKGIAQYNHRARQLGAQDRQVDRFILEALFATVTNVNFDSERLAETLQQAARVRDTAKRLYQDAAAKAGKSIEELSGAATWTPAEDVPGLVQQGEMVSVLSRRDRFGPDAAGLQELLLYGVKGAAAYADHALILDSEDDEVYAFFSEALWDLAEQAPEVDRLVGLCLKCGEINLKVMELLDAAHTNTYGHPTPTSVRVEPVKGKAIVVSGHDLKDLEELLKQTEGKGINIYTHGEMLPAHGYPGLKKYSHFVGNYGGAWQDQKLEFAKFPGAILMTTNCIQEPNELYQDRIFTCGLVAWPGVKHISNRDFTPVIEAPRGSRFRGRRPGSEHHGRIRPQCRPGRSGPGDRGRQERRHQAVLPHRRLRRRAHRTRLLHRVRRVGSGRLCDPNAGLRQVPVQQTRLRHDRWHPAFARSRPV